jgi:hypothetical protein
MTPHDDLLKLFPMAITHACILNTAICHSKRVDTIVTMSLRRLGKVFVDRDLQVNLAFPALPQNIGADQYLIMISLS